MSNEELNIFLAGFFSGVFFFVMMISLLVYLIKKDESKGGKQ